MMCYGFDQTFGAIEKSGTSSGNAAIVINDGLTAQVRRQISSLASPIPHGEKFPNHKQQEAEEIHQVSNRCTPEDVYAKFVAGEVANHKKLDTLVLIKGHHITCGEYSANLKVDGEISVSFMSLCTHTMMADWNDPKRFIIDPVALTEAQGPEANLGRLHQCLRQIPQTDLETLYLPSLNSKHWILAILYLAADLKYIEIYDSLGKRDTLPVFLGTLIDEIRNHPATAFLNIPAATDLQVMYPDFPEQENSHDCWSSPALALAGRSPTSPVSLHSRQTIRERRRKRTQEVSWRTNATAARKASFLS